VCLLVAFFRVHPEAPLIIAANRDELIARPATPMTVLRQESPRIQGGRDDLAGGTWLAVNEHGLVAGLTNVPSPTRDASKRSRGEIPLALAAHLDARSAAADLRAIAPSDYNPCWVLAGDRTSLHYADVRGEAVAVEELAPGVHVLENKPLGEPSLKVDFVRRAMEPALSLRGDALVGFLQRALASHEIPEGADRDGLRPIERYAACVHAGPYGTRSSTIVVVPDHAPPAIWFTDGPPCSSQLRRL
jgi:uncharacterized protein with NRDE domain